MLQSSQSLPIKYKLLPGEEWCGIRNSTSKPTAFSCSLAGIVSIEEVEGDEESKLTLTAKDKFLSRYHDYAFEDIAFLIVSEDTEFRLLSEAAIRERHSLLYPMSYSDFVVSCNTHEAELDWHDTNDMGV